MFFAKTVVKITKAALSRELSVSTARISQYVKEGLPVLPDGKLDRQAALAWVKDRRQFVTGKNKGAQRASTLITPQNGVLASLEAERTRKIRLENDETERRLVPFEDVMAVLDMIVGPLASDLAAVAPRVTDDVPLRKRIEDEISEVLGALAERFSKAGTDLREGRDALAPEPEADADGVGPIQ